MSTAAIFLGFAIPAIILTVLVVYLLIRTKEDNKPLSKIVFAKTIVYTIWFLIALIFILGVFGLFRYM